MTRRIRSFGVENRWWILLAILLVAASAIVVLRPARLQTFGHRAREPVALFPGLTAEDAPPPRQGLIVTSLRSNSEAARSGIAVGDDIERIDGRPVRQLDEAINYLRRDRNPVITLEIAHGARMRAVRLQWPGEHRNGA